MTDSKPELVVVRGPHRGRTVSVENRSEVFVGRSSSAELCLRQDKKVSQLHAKLLSVGGHRFVIADLGSTNGTFVNGERIEQTPLQSGDRVRIGHSLIVYRTDANEIRDSDFDDFAPGSSEEAAELIDSSKLTPLVASAVATLERSGNCGAALDELLPPVARALGAALGLAIFDDAFSGKRRFIARFPAEGPEPKVETEAVTEAARLGVVVHLARLQGPGPIAVPIKLCGRVSGALYFDDRGDDGPNAAPPLTKPDELQLSILGDAISIAVSRDRQRRAADAAAEVLALMPRAGQRSSVSLSLMLRTLLDLFEQGAREHGFDLSRDIEPELAVGCDERLLNRALEAGLRCAGALARDAIHVAARRSPGGAHVQVALSFSGRGFDEDSASELFSARGVAADLRAALERGYDGQLFLARALFELAGGEVSFRSQGPGKGASLLVSLPAADGPPQGLGEVDFGSRTERYI